MSDNRLCARDQEELVSFETLLSQNPSVHLHTNSKETQGGQRTAIPATPSLLSLVTSYFTPIAGASSGAQAQAKASAREQKPSGQTSSETPAPKEMNPLMSLSQPSKGPSLNTSSSAKKDKPLPNLPLFATLSSSNASTSGSAGNMLYSRPSQQEYWMKDEHVKECYDCKAPFTTFRRKHHCRICGQIFCFKCASAIIQGDRFGFPGDIRVCNYCLKTMQLQHGASSGYGGEQHQQGFLDVPTFFSSGSLGRSGISGSNSQLSSSWGSTRSLSHHPVGTSHETQGYGTETNLATPTISLSPADSGPTSPALPSLQRKWTASLDRKASSSSVAKGGYFLPSFTSPFSSNPLPTFLNPKIPQTEDVEEDQRSSSAASATHSANVSGPPSANVSLDNISISDLPISNSKVPFFPKESSRDELGDSHPALYNQQLEDQEEEWVASPFRFASPSSQLYPEDPFGPTGENHTGASRPYPPPRVGNPPLRHEFSSRSLDRIKRRKTRSFSSRATSSRGQHNQHGRSALMSRQIQSAHPFFTSSSSSQLPPPPSSSIFSPYLGQIPPNIQDNASMGLVKFPDTLFMSEKFGEGASRGPGSPILEWDENQSLQSLQSETASPGSPQGKQKNLHRRLPSFSNQIELSSSFLQYIRSMLRQVLSKFQIPQPKIWEKVVYKLLLKVCDQVNPQVRMGDDMDVRHFVKIKRIPGGSPPDSHCVSGVVCSKNVAHKKMTGSKKHPKILLLTFALEYQRVENEFISLEPLFAQEKEHLKNLVARVVALKPDLVLVQKTVSRLALGFLLDSGVAVAMNVKPSVIEAIARCTRADIISSIDKLVLEPRLGTCESFYLRTFHHPDIPGVRKTMMYFDGCAPSLGCTLVLRGQDMDTLSKLKQICDFMVFITYNLKLETYLLRDQFCLAPLLEEDALEEPEENTDGISSPLREASLEDPGESEIPLQNRSIEERLKDMLKAYTATKLSASPQIHFPAPYLLQKKCTQEKSQNSSFGNTKHKNPDTENKLANDAVPPLKISDEDGEIIASAIDSSRPLTSSVPKTEADVEYLLDKAKKLLDPFLHQNLAVLYSLHCQNTQGEPCQPPELQWIEYYRESDFTVGQYIEDLCFNAYAACSSKGCEQLLIQHSRIYTHGSGKMTVSLEKMPCPIQGMEDVILMWSQCKTCQESTPCLPISEETWKYSFGKYLELTFYQSDLGCRADICPHVITRDHIRYFGFKNLAVTVEFFPINLYEVVVPPMRLDFKPDILMKLRQADLDDIRNLITAYFDSVSERIKHFSYDILPPNKVQQAKDVMAEMTKRCQSEKKFLVQLLQQTSVSAHPTDSIALNAVVKALLEKVAEWDAEFNTFVRNFVSNEPRDIRRMTAVQIKKILPGTSSTPEAKVSVTTIQPENNQPITEIEMDVHVLHSDGSSLPVLGTSPDVSGDPMTSLLPLSIRTPDRSTPKTHINRRWSIQLLKNWSALDHHIHFPRLSSSPKNSSLLTAALLDEQTKFSESLDTSTHSLPEVVPEIPPGTALLSTESLPDVARSVHDEVTDSPSIKSQAIELATTPTNAISSPPPPKKSVISSEDEEPSDWNTITGVSVEAEEALDEEIENSENAFLPGERTSIMKTITNLWTGNPANFLPLEYPSSSSEHFFPDSLIVVREEEPTTIIAFTLGSKHYKDKLQAKRNGNDSGDLKQPSLLPTDDNIRYSIEADDQFGDTIEETLMKVTGTHIRYQFWDKTARLSCKIFFAEQFSALRQNCGVEDMFVKSLARCIKWDATGGKSGSIFMKTRDDRFVIKQLSRMEMDALYKFAPAYFEYMSHAFFHELPTMLAKIFGFYRISFKNSSTGKQIKMDVVVMENIFWGRQISKIFDLKGSVRNRLVKSTGNQAEVLLDENLMQYINESPLWIREHSKKLLRASVWNDTLFLSKLNVMDYSLLVGIDEENHELVLGIVDFVRTFTWDKKLESWVKETGFLGGGGKEPTIVSPRQYKVRFREAMERYFLMVPDKYFCI